jgi:hypothetical protein
MISGFMIVRDVLSQGYPFVEAIASALPICDEFLISDGYSTDGTYEVVKRIASMNPKVKVYREKWPDKKDITVLADVTNNLRKKCRFEYIFSVQANEIIHEQSVPFIKALPQMFPNVESFSFPYLQLLNKYRLTEEFRLRFAKNLPSIVAQCDAWTLGASKEFDRTKKLRCLAKPYRIPRYISKGITLEYANSCCNPLSRAVYLPNPVFRYWSLFPKNFVNKYERHRDLFHLEGFGGTEEFLKRAADPDVFWKLACNALRESKFKQQISYPDNYDFVSKKDHPAIIQEFISNPNVDQYYVREELLEFKPETLAFLNKELEVVA